MKKKEAIIQQISKLHPAISGIIRKVHLKCGKKNCRCQSGEEKDRHGPYYFWARTVNGKLTSTSVPGDKVAVIKSYIANRKKLEKLIKTLLDQGQEQALKLIRE